MSGLADLQRRLRDAVIGGDPERLSPILTGGRDPRRRLAVHGRHYAASLTRVLVERFPATCWLAGSPLVVDAARTYITHHPPARPCMAEYGEQFPAFLGSRAEARCLPYLEQFATLEWHAARLALATGDGAIDLSFDWPVDELLSFYLTDSAPDQYVLTPGPVRVNVRGDRGRLVFTRREIAQ